jgi:beta-phosphoglucomutase family hydrolase
MMNENNQNKTLTTTPDSGKILPAAIIFDMDGTLVATTEADFLAWQRVFSDAGKKLSFEDYFPLLGKKSQDVVHHELKLQGKEAEHALHSKMKYFEEIVGQKGIAMMPHAESLLKELKALKIPLALATSSRKLKMELVLEEVGILEYFTVLVSGEDVINGKPKPDIFLLAASKLQVPPEHCVVLEDAVTGVTAAKAAGMKCIAITNTHEADDLTIADMVIRDFSELSLPVISALF